MFKLHRHRFDRLGERLEFRFSSLQAFQIPRGWDRLILSLVSVESGKIVAKTGKATVRSGTCQWTDTLSESIWTPTDGASKETEDSVFKLVVSMGSHRSGILGELIVNLADHMTSRDSGSLSIPLKRCNYGTILQVRIQCLNPKGGFRDIKNSKETTLYSDRLHTSNDMDRKSDGSESMFNRAPSAEFANQDRSFSASGSHRSSDSGDSFVGRTNFSPRNNVNGGSYMGLQDSTSSHVADDFPRSNPSSFNSRASGTPTPQWQDSMRQTSVQGPPSTLRASDSSKDLEIAEETIEELQDEVKMWERHSQKLKLEIEKFKKECLERSKRQAEQDVELSAARAERDCLKQEVEQLKLSLQERTNNQTSMREPKSEVVLNLQKELEDELKYWKESNGSLSLQLSKSQEANLELVSILEELEETVEKQKLEIASLQQLSPAGEDQNDSWRQKLLDVEAEWKAKFSKKEEEILSLEEKLSSMLDSDNATDRKLSPSYGDLMKEIRDLKDKVQELERDCTELTEENLELIYKIQRSGNNIKENGSENSDTETNLLKAQIRRLQEEIRKKEVLDGDLETKLQYFKDRTCDLDTKLRESQLELEEKMSELTELQQKLDGDQEELGRELSLREKEIDDLTLAKEELELLVSNLQIEKGQLQENLSSALRESSITSKCLDNVQHDMAVIANSLDSLTSTNEMLERKLIELKNSKVEQEIQSSKLEEENAKLSKCISAFESQLRFLTDESQRKISEFVKKVDFLESKLSSMQNEIASKEKMLTEESESILEQHEDQEDKINCTKLMLNQIDAKNAVEVENLKREIADLTLQVSATHSEREKMASDAILEVSGLRSDKMKLENDLKLYETELQSLRLESGKKTQGLVDSLKVSNYEKQQMMEETSSLKAQLVQMVHLQGEILFLTSSIEKAKVEREKLEELLKAVSEECEGLKTEKLSLAVKIANMQKALDDGEKKMLKLETDLRAKEVLCVQEAEFRNEIDRIKRENSECETKIQCLEHEKAMVPEKDNNELRDLEAKIQDLQAKIIVLEKKLAESLETNRTLMAEKQSRDSQHSANHASENKEENLHSTASSDSEPNGAQQSTRVAALETELKDMKERYLHMSLQYAQVEAQREELVLKLKANAPKGGKGWFS